MPLSLEYIAGFFDGEGTVTVTRQRSISGFITYTARASVANTYAPVIGMLLEQYPYGEYIKQHGYKDNPLHVWAAYNDKAVRFLREMAPHLIVKREQAELVLRLDDVIKSYLSSLPKTRTIGSPPRTRHPHGHVLPIEEANRREEIVRRIYFLNGTLQRRNI